MTLTETATVIDVINIYFIFKLTIKNKLTKCGVSTRQYYISINLNHAFLIK